MEEELEKAYNQATLPIAKGGLGLRLASEIALSGFLSSVCATKLTTRLLLPINVTNATNIFWDSAFEKWKHLSTKITSPENPMYQSNWDKEIYEHNYQSLLMAASSKEEKARILTLFEARQGQFDPQHHAYVCSFAQRGARITKIGDFVSVTF